MKVRRVLPLLLVVGLLGAACTSGTPQETGTALATDPQATEAGTEPAPETTTSTAPVEDSAEVNITLGLQLEPPTLDLTSSSVAGIPQVLLYNVYEGLVKLETDGSITGLLADSWDVSDDGLEWTFYLRQGVAFHNGDPMTAADVVFSINNVLTKDPAHPFATTLTSVADVEAVDDFTVRVTLSRFSANFLFFMTQGQGVILNERAIDDIENSPVGTGPFAFDSWTPGDSIVITRNADYWGDPALVGSITYRYINDPNALNNAMLAGDIDILVGVSAPELLGVFEANDRFVVLTGQTNGEVTMALNGFQPPLDQILVRQAITHAIDRQAVIDLAYFGYGELIGTGASPLDPYYVDLNDVYPYDPDRARKLLKEAGYADDRPLRMVLPPVSYARRGGEIVAAQLAEVGITVEIENVEWGVWYEGVFLGHDYDISIVAHVEPRDLGQYGNPDYYWAYDNADVAALIAEADATPGDATRYALLGQVQEQITADAANVWLFLLPSLSVTRAGITGYEPNQPGLGLDLTQLALNP